jgi:D-alanyl-D-alanine carboxypeptidase
MARPKSPELRAPEQSATSSAPGRRRALVLRAVVAGLLALVAAACSAPATTRPLDSAGAATTSLRRDLRDDLDTYLRLRGQAEHVSAAVLSVNVRGRGHTIDVAAGTTQFGGSQPVAANSLVQIGSNTKAFTAVVMLQLEAENRLSIDDTLGRWLPQYPRWRAVTIRSLFNMTSGISTYDAEPAFMKDYAADPSAFFSPERLVSYVKNEPRKHGYNYSNTNYVLAEMIIKKVARDTYAHQLYRRILQPLNLRDLYYREHLYPPRVTSREPAGYFFLDQAPPLAPLLGHDLSRDSLSWGRSAGGIVGTLSEMTVWDRALYTGRLLPARQQAELLSLISTRTGKPIQRSSPQESGFGLGVQQATNDKFGIHWAYKGGTFGFRTLHVYLPATGLVIAVSLNSFPSDDQIGALMISLYDTLAAHGIR